MKIGEAFPGQYLKAQDLGNARVPVTIDRVEMEDIGGDHKAVLYFQGKEKGLVLNKTNSSTITELAGTDETDDWRGTRVILFKTRTEYQGKRVDCIRIDEAPIQGRPAPPAPPPPDNFQATDDDVPF
jgi:hypothetical protein